MAGTEGARSSRKLLGMRTAAVPGEFTSVLGSAGAAAFDAGAVDYSKMNAGRHQAAKSNTFNTPGSLVKPFTPAAAQKAQNVAAGPTRELLDIFEMGVSRNMVNLRNELREELAQATDALRQDVMNSIADMRGLNLLMSVDKKVDWLKEGPVHVDFQQVLDEIRLTHTSIRDALQNSTHAIVRQVGQQTRKLGEDLRTAADEQLVLAKDHHDQATAALADNCEQLRSRQDASIELQHALRDAGEVGREEARQMHAESMAHQDRIEAWTDQCDTRDGELAAAVAHLEPQLLRMHDLQQRLHSSQLECGSAVADFEKDVVQFQMDLLPSMQAELEECFERHRITVDLSPVMRQVGLFSHVWSAQFPKMMGEIGKIQEAVNVDFCQEDDYAIDFSVLESFSCGVATGISSMASPPRSRSQSKASFSSPHGGYMKDSTCIVNMTSTMTPHDSTVYSSHADGVSGQSPMLAANFIEASAPAFARSASKKKSATTSKRVRHYWCQTDAQECIETSCQTDGDAMAVVMMPQLSRNPSMGVARKRQREKAKVQVGKNTTMVRRRSQQMLKPVFADSESMKQRARKALIRPQYRVTDMYYTTGVAQKIARSTWFEYVTLAIIFLNAIWIAVDADLNTSPMLFQAPPIFVVVENLFCVYFLFELLTRFFAFQSKRNCLWDRWFVFDAFLVSLMILETWVLTVIFYAIGYGQSSQLSDLSLLRIVRMVKLLRISRMARLMRGLPELFILLKGLRAASRSVALFWALWWIIIYMYALMLRFFNEGDSLYFGSVPDAMNSLLLEGILPAHAKYVREITKENWVHWGVMLSFIAVAYVLLMNMLVGVLVEVVQAIAVTEKEGITVVSLATDLRNVLTLHGVSFDTGLSRDNVEKMISEPDFAIVIEQAGADVVTLADIIQAVFEEQADEDGLLSFEDFVETVLNVRGMNPAKVKDVKGQLRAMKLVIKESEATLRGLILDEVSDMKQIIKDSLQPFESRTGTLNSDDLVDFNDFLSSSQA